MLKPILLVEDNPHDLELTLIALEKSQLANEVIIVRDGAEALDYLMCRGQYAQRQAGNPAVVLLDLKLPKVDGLEVLKAIRSTAGLKSMPVVMLTSSKEEQDLLRSYELGVNAYVVKPVDFAEFVRAIADLGIFWAVLNEPPPGSLPLHQAASRLSLAGHAATPSAAPAAAQQVADARAQHIGAVGLLQQVDRRRRACLHASARLRHSPR